MTDVRGFEMEMGCCWPSQIANCEEGSRVVGLLTDWNWMNAWSKERMDVQVLVGSEKHHRPFSGSMEGLAVPAREAEGDLRTGQIWWGL